MVVNSIVMQRSDNPISDRVSQSLGLMRIGLKNFHITIENLTDSSAFLGDAVVGPLASLVIVVTEALSVVTGVLQVIWGVVGGVGVFVVNNSRGNFRDFASVNISQGCKAIFEGLSNVVLNVILCGIYVLKLCCIAEVIGMICVVGLLVVVGLLATAGDD